MKFDYYTHTIASCYLSAIINEDWTGLADDEAADLQAWLDDVPNKVEHWGVEDDSGSFGRDEVTGLMADCVIIRSYFKA